MSYYLAGYASPQSRTTLVGARTFEVEDGSTSSVTTVVTLRHITTGTAAAGIGTRLLYQAENGGGTATTSAGAIDAVLTTVTAGSEVSRIDIYPVSAGALVTTATAAFAPTAIVYTQTVATTGSPTFVTYTGAAHTTLAASTEAPDIDYGINRTVQFSSGGLTTQRAVIVRTPTYAFDAGSTLTNPIVYDILSAPAAGTSATFTSPRALRVGSAAVTLGATTAGFNYATIAVPAHTITVTGGTGVTATVGASALSLGIVTVTDTTAMTMDAAATLYIAGAPAAGSSTTITNAYAIWVDAGSSRFDGAVNVTGANQLKLGDEANTFGIYNAGSEVTILTNSLRNFVFTSTSGDMRLVTYFTAGTVSAPGISNSSNTDTGILIGTTDVVTIAAGAANIAEFRPATTGGGWMIMDEADSDPGTAVLDTVDSVAIYNKNGKIVFAFNYSGTIGYLTCPLDTSTTTWTNGTVAP